MKDNWFEFMLSFFEKAIADLQEHMGVSNADAGGQDGSGGLDELTIATPGLVKVQVEQLQAPKPESIRVFTSCEQMKLTRASHQFLVRLAATGLFSPETMELILNRLLFSESRIVSLQETKWMIRNTLSRGLNFDQMAFIDMVLYHKEDRLPLH